jgi:hypothetical protein
VGESVAVCVGESVGVEVSVWFRGAVALSVGVWLLVGDGDTVEVSLFGAAAGSPVAVEERVDVGVRSLGSKLHPESPPTSIAETDWRAVRRVGVSSTKLESRRDCV